MAGEVDVENFMENYISQRRVAHQRRVKVEKMKEILSRPNQGASASGYPGPPPAANNWNAPYPNYSGMPNANNYYPQ